MPESVFSMLLFSTVDPSELEGETTLCCWCCGEVNIAKFDILPGELAFDLFAAA